MRPGWFRRWWKSARVRRLRHTLSEALLFPLVGALCRVWFWLLHRGVRYDRRGPLFEFIADGRPCIVALWHQDVFPIMFELFRYTPRYPSCFLVSDAWTGRLGTHLLEIWGFECVPASGGAAAVESLGRALRERPRSAFLMADGSRGPTRQARWGAVHLARRSGLPIVAVRAWGDNLVTLRRTWMRLVLPRPWGRAVLLSSQPLQVPADAERPELDACRRELERRLEAMADAAARYFVEGPDAVRAWGPPLPAPGAPQTSSSPIP